MQGFKKDLLRALYIVVASPFTALIAWLLRKQTYTYWLKECFIYSLISASAFLTIFLLYRIYEYADDKEQENLDKAKKIINKHKK